jgi:hypothetical protein
MFVRETDGLALCVRVPGLDPDGHLVSPVFAPMVTSPAVCPP